jgi:hypothetical protein
LQLHYLSLFLAFIIVIYIFLGTYFKNKKINKILLLKKYIYILLGSIISLTPIILFEFRHNFLNTKGIFTFIFGNTVSYATNTNFFLTVIQVYFRIFGRLIVDFPQPERAIHFSTIQLVSWGSSIMILSVASLVLLFFHKNKQASLILGLWLMLGVLLLGFYKKEIFDYLFTFMFPLPFLLIGNLVSFIYNFSKKQRLLCAFLSLIIFFSIFTIDLLDIPLRYEPNNQRDQTREIAQFVISKATNKSYNFALLSGGNADYAYRYYLDILNKSPITIQNLELDPQRKSVSQQLFVVCEDIKCKPLGNALWEVAGFGRAEIVDEWNISVVKVYKLVPFNKQKS